VAERAEDDFVYADKQLLIRRTWEPPGLAISGVIDLFNVEAFARRAPVGCGSSPTAADGVDSSANPESTPEPQLVNLAITTELMGVEVQTGRPAKAMESDRFLFV